MVIYYYSQVIFSNNLFDQVVRAVLLELVRLCIESQVVVFRPDIAHTFTFIVKAAFVVVVIDFDEFASIYTDEFLYIGTDSGCRCDLAFGASSCGAVADLPGLSILSC